MHETAGVVMQGLLSMKKVGVEMAGAGAEIDRHSRRWYFPSVLCLPLLQSRP